MKVKSVVNAYYLTAGEIYEVLFEYETTYEIVCDNGMIYCRNKDFFELINP